MYIISTPLLHNGIGHCSAVKCNRGNLELNPIMSGSAPTTKHNKPHHALCAMLSRKILVKMPVPNPKQGHHTRKNNPSQWYKL